jgi:hypothetical protein
MGRKKTEQPEQLLSRSVILRITEADYQKYDQLCQDSDCGSVAEVLRRILSHTRVICFQKDKSMDGPMEILTGIQKELQYIGHNINQLTKGYHRSKDPGQQAQHMQQAAEQYQKVQAKVHVLLTLIAQLSKTWLQK